ncbi:MAG TPA: HEAT repeat domain-containing protein, partial [Aldersonia sp.]
MSEPWVRAMEACVSSPEVAAAAAAAAKGAASAVGGQAAKKMLRRATGSAEAKALTDAVAMAFVCTIEESALDQRVADVDWWGRAGKKLLAPFTDPKVAEWVVTASLSNPDDPIEAQQMLLGTIADRGRDFTTVAQELSIDADQFLHLLPGTIVDEVVSAAHQVGSPLRGLAQLVTLGRIAEHLDTDRIAPLSPRELRRQVAELLERERRRHERAIADLPYLAGHPDPIALDTAVGVRVGVRRNISESSTGTDVYTPAAGRAANSPDQTMPWSEAIERHERLVVLADPGMGKSWLIHTHAARLAATALRDLEAGSLPDELVIPIAIRCDTIAARAPQTLALTCSEVLAERHNLSPALRRWLTEHIDTGPVVYLLDALDELPRTARQPFTTIMTAWEATAPTPARVVITSRITGYTGILRPPTRTEVELLPFTVDDVDTYLHSWGLSPDNEKEVRDRLVEAPALAGMARVPLLLALLCDLALEPDALPRTRTGIYGRIMRRLLRAEHRTEAALTPEDDPFGGDDREREQRLLDIARPLAFAFADTDRGWIDQMPTPQVLNALKRPGAGLPAGIDPARALTELSTGTGVLIPAGDTRQGADPPYLFVHRTLAEYLVAEHLAHLDKKKWKKVLNKHLWFDPEWEPVWPLLSGSLHDPTDLLKVLLTQPHDPVHHALLTAARIAEDLTTDSAARARPQLDKAATRLIALLKTPARDEARIVLAAVLPHVSSTAVTDALLTLLQDQNDDVRWAAAEALAGREGSAVTDALL